MDEKRPLPEGWITHESKSHPGRVYYFNVNTGDSSWEFPGIIQSGHILNLVPSPPLPASKQPSKVPSENLVNNKRKHSAMVPAQSPVGKIAQPSSTNNTDKVIEPAQKKVKFSPIKFPTKDKSGTVKCGIVNEPELITKPTVKEKVTRSLKRAFDGSEKTSTESDHNKVNVTKISTKVNLSNSKQNIDKREPSKPASSKSKLVIDRGKDAQQGSKKGKDVKDSVKIIDAKGKSSETKIMSQKTKVNSSQPSLAKAANLTSKTIPDKTKTDAKNTNSCDFKRQKQSKETNNKIKKEVTTIDLTTESDSADKRKVVKSIQKEVKQKERTVTAAKGKKLTVKATKTSETGEEEELDKNNSSKKPLFHTGDESPISLVDSDNETKLKNFIGNKDKLLSIQSWIDNLQDGSDSPRKEFYGLPNTSQTTSSLVNESSDSGFLSPSVKPERGWPGAVKTSSVSSRQLVDMEVEPWQLPEVDTSRVEEAMDVDIDEIISEVRQLIKQEGTVSTSEKWEQGSTEGTISQLEIELLDVDIDEIISEARQLIKQEGSVSISEKWEQGSNEGTISQGVVIVVDTNIFLNNLNLVETLKDKNIPDFGRPTILIPWIVLRELDVIKSRAEEKHKVVQNKARKAIWLLKSFFSQKLGNVRGQTPRQYEEAQSEFKADCNDDSALQACLQCKQLYDQCEVMLLTNDNNLIVKSFVAGVPAYTANEIQEGLQKLKSKSNPYREANNNSIPCSSHITNNHNITSHRHSVQYNTSGKHSTCIHNSYLNTSCDNSVVNAQNLHHSGPSLSGSVTFNNPAQSNITYPNGALPTKCDKQTVNAGGNYDKIPVPHPSQPHCIAENMLQEERNYTLETLLDDMYTKLITVLKEGFGKVLEEEMKRAYDDIWLQIVLKKPPWSLLDILQCWKKHWIAIFGMVFRRSLISNVEKLLCAFKSKIPHSLQSICDKCKDSYEILLECVTLNRYGDTMIGIKECVLCLYELCDELINNKITVQSISSLSDYLKSKLVPEKCSNSIISPQNSVCSERHPSGNIPQSPRIQQQHVNHSIPQSPAIQPRVNPLVQSPEIQQHGHLISPPRLPVGQYQGIPPLMQLTIPLPSGHSQVQNVVQATGIPTQTQTIVRPPVLQPHVGTIAQSPLHQHVHNVPQSPSFNPLSGPIVQSPGVHHHVQQVQPPMLSPGLPPQAYHHNVNPVSNTQQFLSHHNIQTHGHVDQNCSRDSLSDSSAGALNARLNPHREPDQPPGDMIAAELLQHIWQFLSTSCHRITQAITNQNTMDVEKLLHQIVPLAKDLRIMYVGLLEIPVPKLSMHELDFNHFTDMCNTFFSRCGEMEPVVKLKASPVFFLMLFSNMVHRQTLVQFQAQLDDMLRHLYHCLQVVFPDD